MTAEERGAEMMCVPMNSLPPLALEYAKHLCNMYGMCGEVLMTAWCHYAQAVEELKSSEPLYTIDQAGLEWFRTKSFV